MCDSHRSCSSTPLPDGNMLCWKVDITCCHRRSCFAVSMQTLEKKEVFISLLQSSLSRWKRVLVFGLFAGVAPPHGDASPADACAVEAPVCMDWFRPTPRAISCVGQPSSVGLLCHKRWSLHRMLVYCCGMRFKGLRATGRIGIDRTVELLHTRHITYWPQRSPAMMN